MASQPPNGSPEPTNVPARSEGSKVQNDAWGAMGLVMSGVLVWGGVGYLVSEWLHHTIFVMVGLLVGMGVALYGVWFRYGRS